MTHTLTNLAGTDPAMRQFGGILEHHSGELDAFFEALKRYSRKAAHGHMFFQEGDETDQVIVVLKGWLATSKALEDGDAQIIDFALPGDVVETVAGDGFTSDVTLEAVSDAEVAIVPAATWNSLLKASPHLEAAVERVRAAARARMTERLLRMGKGSAPMRVAYALIELCVRLRAIGEADSCEYHLPLTQKTIGDFTGLSAVHVCRTMRRLERQAIIDAEDHIDIRILDVPALSDIAQTDPDLLMDEIIPAVT
ncbi:MAG: Crp/Fnr family transcriptional regulator [Paracoccaceae bacterium]|nr:Crp/Fnr family transcriptional regulator [Paracoccaceae bacterium]